MTNYLGFLFSLIFCLPLWSACTGAEASPTLIPTAIPLVETTTSTELNETYRGNNELVNARLTVNYPSTWTAHGSGTNLQLASENPELASDSTLLINIAPLDTNSLVDLENINAEEIVVQALQATTGQTVSATATSFNDRESAYATASFEENSARVYAIQFAPEVFVVMSVIRARTFSPDDDVILISIAGSIDYRAGEIPQGDN